MFRSTPSRPAHADLPRILQPDLVEVPVLRKNGPGPDLYLSETAVDVTDSASVSSMEVASLRVPNMLPGDKVRRRGSELSRARPSNLRPDSEHEALELQPLPTPLSERAVDFPVVCTPDHDVEVGPSISNSVAVSVRSLDETDSTAPVISAEQRALFKRRGRLHFAAICFSFFLEGWNDGSTGPLLPAIQKHYNVSAVITLRALGILMKTSIDRVCNSLPTVRSQLRRKLLL